MPDIPRPDLAGTPGESTSTTAGRCEPGSDRNSTHQNVGVPAAHRGHGDDQQRAQGPALHQHRYSDRPVQRRRQQPGRDAGGWRAGARGCQGSDAWQHRDLRDRSWRAHRGGGIQRGDCPTNRRRAAGFRSRRT